MKLTAAPAKWQALLFYGIDYWRYLRQPTLYMHLPTFTRLHQQGLIPDDALQLVKDHSRKPIQLNNDLRVTLYAGILFLTSGLGIIIYKNIDRIGHLAIISTVSIATLLCFVYSFKNALPFTWRKSSQTTLIYDYVLLLGCLLLLIVTGYLQLEYNVFGQRWGLATFIPMCILFAAAYYFDHLGVLSMAIVNLAAWLGITVTPLHLFKVNDFSNHQLIYAGLVLGAVLIAISLLTRHHQLKQHFTFTYYNFGTHFLLLSALIATFTFDAYYFLWFPVVVIASSYTFFQALQTHSFYFLVVATIYFYAGISYVFIRFITANAVLSNFMLYILLLYLILSAVALLMFLMRYNKIFRQHDRIQ